MRVFVTGATGFVGSAIVREFIASGHQVLGLTRSDDGAKVLAAAGTTAHRGTLEDLDSLREGARHSDAVIHCAFNHDWANFARSCELDKNAILAMGGVLEGSRRQLLVTSGLAALAPGRIATEADQVPGDGPRASEAAAACWSRAACARPACGLRHRRTTPAIMALCRA